MNGFRHRRPEIRAAREKPTAGTWRCRSGLDRGLSTYRKVRKDRSGKAERGADTREIYGRGGELLGSPEPRRPPAFGTERARPWAGEIDAADVNACQGFVPARCTDLLVAEVERPSSIDGSSAWRPSVLSGAGSGDPRPTEGAADGDGSSAWRPSVLSGAGSGDPRPTAPVDRADSSTLTTDDGQGGDVTYEANFYEDVISSQSEKRVDVTADSSVGSGLDSVTEEANFGELPETTRGCRI